MFVQVEIFAIITAVVIVAVRLILNVMEERDRAKGMAVSHEEYKMSYILKTIIRERWNGIKNFLKKKKQGPGIISEKANQGKNAK